MAESVGAGIQLVIWLRVFPGYHAFTLKHKANKPEGDPCQLIAKYWYQRYYTSRPV